MSGVLILQQISEKFLDFGKNQESDTFPESPVTVKSFSIL